jgi:DNA-binding MarR family transcriptional regulator
VAEVSSEAAQTVRNIVELRERHRVLILESFGRAASNGLKVMESLYSRPILSVSDIRALIGVSFTAANNLMNRFVGLGLLTEVTGHARNRQFRYGPYIELFADR